MHQRLSTSPDGVCQPFRQLCGPDLVTPVGLTFSWEVGDGHGRTAGNDDIVDRHGLSVLAANRNLQLSVRETGRFHLMRTAVGHNTVRMVVLDDEAMGVDARLCETRDQFPTGTIDRKRHNETQNIINPFIPAGEEGLPARALAFLVDRLSLQTNHVGITCSTRRSVQGVACTTNKNTGFLGGVAGTGVVW